MSAEPTPSLYEKLKSLTDVTIARQRVVENFSGESLDERWTQSNYVGTGTFGMVDEIDGGFSIQSGGTALDFSGIDFNDKRQYDFDNSIIIMVIKTTDNSQGDNRWGFINDRTTELALEFAIAKTSNVDTFFSLHTADATTANFTASSIPKDTNFHNFKLDLKTSTVDMVIDGVIAVTNSTNLPTVKLQPRIATREAGGVATTHIRYCEAYNT